MIKTSTESAPFNFFLTLQKNNFHSSNPTNSTYIPTLLHTMYIHLITLLTLFPFTSHCALLEEHGIHHDFVPTDITTDQIVYALVMVGSPAREYRLELDPLNSGMTIGLDDSEYTSWTQYGLSPSATYDNGHDYVSIGENTYVDNVTYIARTTLPVGISGRWGVSRKSVLWKFYNSASFSVGSIRLGHIHDVLSGMKHASSPLVKCIDDDTTLCKLRVIIDGTPYFLALFRRGKKIFVPPDVYTRYSAGQSLYGYTPLDSIKIAVSAEHFIPTSTSLPTQNECVHSYRHFGFKNVHGCGSTFEIVVSPNMYTESAYVRRNTLLVTHETMVSPTDDTIILPMLTLPTSLLSKVMVHLMFTDTGTYAVLKTYETFGTQSASDLILLFLLSFSYILYQIALVKHADEVLPAPPADQTKQKTLIVYMRSYTLQTLFVVNEAAGYALALVIVSPAGKLHDFLDDYPYLQLVMVGVGAAGTIGLSVLPLAAALPVLSLRAPSLVLLSSVRRFAYECVSIHGLWASFIYLKSSEIGTLATSAAAVWLLFVLARICTETLVTLTHLGPFSLFSWLVVGGEAAVLAHTIFFVYAYNIQPYIRQSFILFTLHVDAISLAIVFSVFAYALFVSLTPAFILSLHTKGRDVLVYTPRTKSD